MLEHAVDGAVFLLNAPYAADEVWEQLPSEVQEQLIDRHIRFYTIDASAVARETGMGGRINTIMQTCFFAISPPRADRCAICRPCRGGARAAAMSGRRAQDGDPRFPAHAPRCYRASATARGPDRPADLLAAAGRRGSRSPPVQEARLRQRRPLRRNRRHAFTDVQHLGQAPAHILEEGPQARQALIPCCHLVVPRRLQMLQEAEHPLEGQMLDLQPISFLKKRRSSCDYSCLSA